ncbi:MAG: ATP-binding protein [Nitrospirota bacterium]
MKIEQRIIISNVFNVGLMVLIGVLAYQALNLMLTKLRFVEIADDLNASFLEMRLSEKNFFLYKDPKALSDIKEKIKAAQATVYLERYDIARAVGQGNLGRMSRNIGDYSKAIDEAMKSCPPGGTCEAALRARGKDLREFSETITRLERARVGDIISASKTAMLFFLIVIILSAIAVSHKVSQDIVRSLRKIEGLAKSIAGGNFHQIEKAESDDELDSVIEAVNSMSAELKNREEELLQSKKLASMGILTAGVAHEITNPVNNISMIAQTYAEVYDSMDRRDRIEFMKKVELEADRIRDIVKNLLNFSKPKKADLKESDINDVIRDSMKLVQNMLDINKIEVKLDLKKKLPPVFIDEPQIQQVLVNLIVNAAQAMPEGGWLNISSKFDKEKGQVRICVSDTGMGIPPEYIPHVFDPFFSTKGVGGTGLGLSVSYGIIKNHNGSIRVDSGIGTGTTFVVEFPANWKSEVLN